MGLQFDMTAYVLQFSSPGLPTGRAVCYAAVFFLSIFYCPLVDQLSHNILGQSLPIFLELADL